MPGNNNNNNNAKKARSELPDGALTFACPYCKHPEHAGQHARCRGIKSLRHMSDVREHFNRCHSRDPFCPVCNRIFTGKNRHTDRDAHINLAAADGACTAGEHPPPEPEGHQVGFSKEKLDAMFDNWKTDQSLGYSADMTLDQRKWRGLWVALFPDRKDACPDAYHYETPQEEHFRQGVERFWDDKSQHGYVRELVEKYGPLLEPGSDYSRLLTAFANDVARETLQGLLRFNSSCESNGTESPVLSADTPLSRRPPARAVHHGALSPARSTIIRGPVLGSASLNDPPAPASQMPVSYLQAQLASPYRQANVPMPRAYIDPGLGGQELQHLAVAPQPVMNYHHPSRMTNRSRYIQHHIEPQMVPIDPALLANSGPAPDTTNNNLNRTQMSGVPGASTATNGLSSVYQAQARSAAGPPRRMMAVHQGHEGSYIFAPDYHDQLGYHHDLGFQE